MMSKLKFFSAFLALGLSATAADAATADTIVSTSAYAWVGDTVFQNGYKAYAPSEYEIVSTYSAQPGYFMPVDKQWKAKNDLTPYPQLKTPNRLHAAIYNMGLDEMINNVEPDTTLRTGKEWAGVWTRDVSYSIILSMAYLQPEAAMISLRHKVNAEGQIVQDTGSGGAWPVSSDRMVWALAAYEVYKVTGDRKWLEYIYPIIKRSFEKDFKSTYSADGLVHGETSFIDWREQSYPKWMLPADIYQSRAMSTCVVHAAGIEILSKIAADLGHKSEAAEFARQAEKLAAKVNDYFWMDDKGYYAMYDYGHSYPILNPRAETLGESLAILYGIADSGRARSISQNNPVTPFGAAIFFPQIADMPAYHNNALWPFVGSFWAIANAKAGNEQGTLEAIGAVFRPAALFATNKENFVLDNGDIATELNSSNMLWSLAGNLGITYRILFGIHFEENGIEFAPFVPKALGGERTLSNFRYRNADLTITVKGYGDRVAGFTIDGKAQKTNMFPAKMKGRHDIVITMADNDIPPMTVNHTANLKAPLTPRVWLEHDADRAVTGVPLMNSLRWQPVEYAAGYLVLRDGKVLAHTRATEYAATTPGEYQVIALSDAGVGSFASEPLSNRRVLVLDYPGEGQVMKSAEVSYQPKEEILGWHGQGWVETDHKTAVPPLDFSVDASGTYSVTVIYANGNGPVNTENKCAVRSVVVDGKKAGTVVMPHRGTGNWNDWGRSNAVSMPLGAGVHRLELPLLPEDENMNLGTNHAIIDRVIIERIDREQ